MRDHTELNINHRGQNKPLAEENSKSVNLGVDKAIDEFQSKLKSYPLPTPEIGQMAPPPPPQTGQHDTTAKTSESTPKTRSNQSVEKPKTSKQPQVVAKAPVASSSKPQQTAKTNNNFLKIKH